MANELKPCPFCNGGAKILRRSGTAGRVCRSKWYRERVECKVCGLTTREYKKPGSAQHSWNNRHATLTNEANTHPAAPVEGLETVLWQVKDFTDGWFTVNSELGAQSAAQHYGSLIRDLVTRSQAEEILARNISKLSRKIIDLEANNAALTARVARDDAAFQELIKLGKEADTKFEALETQLAAAKKALGIIAAGHGCPMAVAEDALEAKP